MVWALKEEIAIRKEELGNEIVETIYFGGGTPSILQVDEMDELIRAVYSNFNVVENPEITLEANPDDLMSVQKEKRTILEEYVKIGINRLSVGVQSFLEEDLQLMNRSHSAQQAIDSLSVATHHFKNISIDLIYGIPGLSDELWLQNVQKAMSLNIPHISTYALTVEPRTALKKFIEVGKVPPVDDEQAQRQFNLLVEVLEDADFVNYEISNFGKEGFFSKNNTAYWQGKKYLGIGPSAHSFDGKKRGWNVRNNTKYIKALQERRLPIEYEELSIRDRYNEYVMTGLRTIWGVSLSRIERDFGAEFRDYVERQSAKYIKEHLLFFDGETLLASKKGKFLIDGIAADLFVLNLG